MQKSKIAVQVISSGMLPDDTLMLGEAYVKQWKIPQGQPVYLKFGALRQPVKVLPVQRYDGLRIGQGLARRMGLAGNATLRLQYRPASSLLLLGPLIGVLVSRDHPGTPDRPFGAITQFCRELVDGCAQQGGYVYFFTPNDIESRTDQLDAWCYAGGWRKLRVPAPDVVNNRLTTRKLENKQSVQHFFQDVKSRYGTEIFNEKFLDKSEVFEALRKDSGLHRYLPESHMLRGFATLKSMCAKYSAVFLKPVRGSLGKGIIKVTRSSTGGYLALHATSMGTRKQQHATLLKLFASLSGKMKTARYQIQQGLNLIEIGGRPVDFRALVQKNAAGQWSVTSIVARIAGGQHFVSNLARGGTLSPVREAVSKSNAPISGKEALSRLNRASLDIAEGIDRLIPAHFGELGVDLALDTNGKAWLLEVNSKPSKNDNTPLTDKSIRPSVRVMLQYARYLSGYK